MQIGSGKTSAVINVTPMIDILLLLLITFMVMPSPTKGLKSEVPEPAPPNAAPLPNPQDVASVIEVARGAGVARIGLITYRDHP